MGNGGDIPTTNKEFWVILKSLPYHLQILVAVVLLASAINIPDSVYSLLKGRAVAAEVIALADTLSIRVENIELEFSNYIEANRKLNSRVDSLTTLILQNRESLDFLWCLNEKAETPEVRVYCGELRDAVRAALQIRAGVIR